MKSGQEGRLVLLDGTTLEGTVKRSWQSGIIRLENVSAWAREGEVEADKGSYFLVPVRNVAFAQVGVKR